MNKVLKHCIQSSPALQSYELGCALASASEPSVVLGKYSEAAVRVVGPVACRMVTQEGGQTRIEVKEDFNPSLIPRLHTKPSTNAGEVGGEGYMGVCVCACVRACE